METQFDKTLEILFELKVSDAMKSDLITVSPNDNMKVLNEKMSSHRLSGVPVVEGDKLVGIISISDLIMWLEECGPEGTIIADRMITNPECVYADQPLIHAINRFNQLGYGRFPVLDRDSGKLVGIITKGDIIEGTLKKLEEDYKEEEIRQYRASHFFEDIVADKKNVSLTFNIVGKDFDRAGKASTTMKKNLKRLGLPPDIIRRLAIASYEGEMNVVIYADGGTMKYDVTQDRIRLIITDQGPGIEDVEKAMEPGYTTSEPWVKELGFGAGMGLPNMKKCADNMEVKSTVGKGTTVIIEINIGGNDETQ